MLDLRLLMMRLRLRERLQDRATRAAALGFVTAAVLFVVLIPQFILEQSSRRDLERAKVKQKEFTALAEEYSVLKDRLDAIEQRATGRSVTSITQAIDDIVLSTGLKAKLRSVKAVGPREVADQFREESAEVQFDRLSLNETVNTLYKIEQAPMRLLIKRLMIKKSFEKPELLDVSMTLSLHLPPASPK